MKGVSNFLAWVMEDVNDIGAEVGSPRDAQLQEFAAQGFLELDMASSTPHDHRYGITSKWMEALSERQQGVNDGWGKVYSDGYAAGKVDSAGGNT